MMHAAVSYCCRPRSMEWRGVGGCFGSMRAGVPSPNSIAYWRPLCPFFAAPFFRHSSRVGVGAAPGRVVIASVCPSSQKGGAGFRGAYLLL